MSAPAHVCQTPVFSSVVAAATSMHRWWDLSDSSTGEEAVVLWDLSCTILCWQDTKPLRADPIPTGMAQETPSGCFWQCLGLKEHLNHCSWDRLSAPFNNTRITKQACDYLWGCRWWLIWQILGTLPSWSFTARERNLVGVERRNWKCRRKTWPDYSHSLKTQNTCVQAWAG